MPEIRDRLIHLIDELKRRGVLRDAAVYLVAAIRANREYLSYLDDPEPPFDERARRARERLAALAGEVR